MPPKAQGESYARRQDATITAEKQSQEHAHAVGDETPQELVGASERPARRARTMILSEDTSDRPKLHTLARSASLSDAGDPSGLLGLPPELRDHIYGFLAADSIVTVNPKQPGVITDGNTLLGVSKAVRSEYLDVLIKVSQIVVEIENFNFRPLVSFLNKLDQRSLQILRRKEDATTRSITIILILDWEVACPRTLERTEKLRKWLLRCATPSDTEKCGSIEFNYEVKVLPWTGTRFFLQQIIKRWPNPDASRFLYELVKITAAVERTHAEVKAWFRDRRSEPGSSFATTTPDWIDEAERHPIRPFTWEGRRSGHWDGRTTSCRSHAAHTSAFYGSDDLRQEKAHWYLRSSLQQ